MARPKCDTLFVYYGIYYDDDDDDDYDYVVVVPLSSICLVKLHQI
jgi:hypothetical protein